MQDAMTLVPWSEGQMLLRLNQDSADGQPPLLLHPVIQAHLLRALLRGQHALAALQCWRRLSAASSRAEDFPALTLQLAKLLGPRETGVIAELNRFLNRHYPSSQQAEYLALYRQHINQ